MSTYLANKEHLDSGLTMVGDAIRAKTGYGNLMEFPDEFVSKINSITIVKPKIFFDTRASEYGAIPLTLTISYSANATYVDIKVEYTASTLPIFTSVSYITCKQPYPTTPANFGYVMVSDNSWLCAVAGYTDYVSWVNTRPTITILSSTDKILSLRLSGLSKTVGRNMSSTQQISNAYDRAYISVIGV